MPIKLLRQPHIRCPGITARTKQPHDSRLHRRGLVAFVVVLAAGCDSNSAGDLDNDIALGGNPPLTSQSVQVSPVNVMSEFVQRTSTSALPSASDNLLSNGSFETGVEAWTGCGAGTISESAAAYDGEKALRMSGGNCFYQSVSATPGEDVVLSCYSRTLNTPVWSGMGLGFSDAEWNTVSESPATIISSASYARYDVSTTVPNNAAYITMWYYSETDALIDNCTLLPADLAPPPPDLTHVNLLENADFNNFNSDQPDDWLHFCGGGVDMHSINGDSYVRVTEGACLSQGLSASDLAAIQGRDYEYQCDISNGSDRYVTITANLDGVEYSEIAPTYDRSSVSVRFTGPDNLSTGYVSIYSEATPRNMAVYSCSLKALNNDAPNETVQPGDNLLVNGSFDDLDADNKPQGWSKECTGSWATLDSPVSATALELDSIGQPSCARQVLTNEKVALLSNNSYSVNCDVNVDSEVIYSDYAMVRIIHGATEHRHFFPLATDHEFIPFSASGELPELTEASIEIAVVGKAQIDNCTLSAGNGATGEDLALLDIRANIEGLDVYDVEPPFTFDVVVSNIGSLAVSDLAVIDPRGASCRHFPSDLLPGQSIVLQCTENQALASIPDEQYIEIFVAGRLSVEGNPERGVFDSDLIGYSNSPAGNQNAILDIRANHLTVAAGGTASFRVSVAATGNASSISSIQSDQLACTKSYASPMMAGQYDIYDCTVENVTENLTVNVELVSGDGGTIMNLSDSATVKIEQ